MNPDSGKLEQWIGDIDPTSLLEAAVLAADCNAMLALDKNLRIVFWSQGAERLFAVNAANAVGKDYAALIGAPAPHFGPDPPRLIEHDLAVRLPDGGRGSSRIRLRSLVDRSGRFGGALGFIGKTTPEKAELPIPGAEEIESFHGLMTRDPVMIEALRIVRNVAETDATVLIRGESGSGKELVARALHQEGRRRDRPFLAVNCAALSPTLLESELFGHVRGAFTGAVREHAGLFQRADGGTLFLDEVAELPLELQAKLLRVLQERSFTPVGGDRAISVDLRIVAATHRSLREAVKARRFREDLMYRLRVVPVFLPPLRERRQDIALLLGRFVERHNAKGLRRIVRIDPAALKRLLDYQWPGNVRELQNVVEYVFAVGRGEILSLDDLPGEFHEPAPTGTPAAESPGPTTGRSDRIRDALRQADGRIDLAAQLLGVSRATFWRQRKKFGL